MSSKFHSHHFLYLNCDCDRDEYDLTATNIGALSSVLEIEKLLDECTRRSDREERTGISSGFEF